MPIKVVIGSIMFGSALVSGVAYSSWCGSTCDKSAAQAPEHAAATVQADDAQAKEADGEWTSCSKKRGH